MCRGTGPAARIVRTASWILLDALRASHLKQREMSWNIIPWELVSRSRKAKRNTPRHQPPGSLTSFSSYFHHHLRWASARERRLVMNGLRLKRHRQQWPARLQTPLSSTLQSRRLRPRGNKKDTDVPIPEKRGAVLKKRCPKNILDRLDRVFSQRRVMSRATRAAFPDGLTRFPYQILYGR